MGLIVAQNLQPVQLDATEKIVAIHPTDADVMILTQKPDPSAQARDYLSSSYLLYSLTNQEPVFSFKGLLLYVAPDMSRIVRFSGHAIYDYEQESADASGRVSYRVKNKIRVGTFIPSTGTIAKSIRTGNEYFVYVGLTTRKQTDALSYFHQNDYSKPEKVMHMYYGYAIIDLQSPKPSESLVRTCILPIKRRNQIFSIRPNVDENKLLISYINSKSLMLEICLDFNKGYKMYFKDEDTPIQYAQSDDSNHLIYPYLLQSEIVKNTLHQNILHVKSDITFVRFSQDSVYLDVLYNQVTRESLWHLFAVDVAASSDNDSQPASVTETITTKDLGESRELNAHGTYAFDIVRNGGIFPFLPTGSLYYHDYTTNTLQYISKKKLERFLCADLASRCAYAWNEAEADFFLNTPEFATESNTIMELSDDLFKKYKHIGRRLVPVQDALQSSATGMVATNTYATNVLAASAAQPSSEFLRELGEIRSANKHADEALKTIKKELDSLKEEKVHQEEEIDSLKLAVENNGVNYKTMYEAVEELREKQEELQAERSLSGDLLDKDLITKITTAAEVAEQTDLIRNQVLEMDERMAEIETLAAKLAANVEEVEKRQTADLGVAALGDPGAIMSIVNDVKDNVEALRDQVRDQGDHITAMQNDFDGYKEIVNSRFAVLEETIREVQRNIPIDDDDSFDFDPHSIRVEDETDEEEARVRRKYNKLLADDDDDDDFDIPNQTARMPKIIPHERTWEPPAAIEASTKLISDKVQEMEDEMVAGPAQDTKPPVVDESASAGIATRLPDPVPSDDYDVDVPAPEAAVTTLDELNDIEPIVIPELEEDHPASTVPETLTLSKETPDASQNLAMPSSQIDFEDLSVGGWTASPDPKPRPTTLPNAVQSPGDEFENLMKDDFDLGESATLNPNEGDIVGQDLDGFGGDFDDFDI